MSFNLSTRPPKYISFTIINLMASFVFEVKHFEFLSFYTIRRQNDLEKAVTILKKMPHSVGVIICSLNSLLVLILTSS